MNTPTQNSLDSLVEWFETLTPESVSRTAAFYAPDATFKDPFNEVTGVERIERIYAHMFGQVLEPRFHVLERIQDGSKAVLIWEFHFRNAKSTPVTIVRGASHLHFNADGLISLHRDYWDAAEELYAKAPGLGLLMRWLQSRLMAPPNP